MNIGESKVSFGELEMKKSEFLVKRNGYFQLYRSVFTCPHWEKDDKSEFFALIWLLAFCLYEEVVLTANDRYFLFGPGDFIYSEDQLCEAWGFGSRRRVKMFLDKLVRDKFLTRSLLCTNEIMPEEVQKKGLYKETHKGILVTPDGRTQYKMEIKNTSKAYVYTVTNYAFRQFLKSAKSNTKNSNLLGEESDKKTFVQEKSVQRNVQSPCSKPAQTDSFTPLLNNILNKESLRDSLYLNKNIKSKNKVQTNKVEHHDHNKIKSGENIATGRISPSSKDSRNKKEPVKIVYKNPEILDHPEIFNHPKVLKILQEKYSIDYAATVQDEITGKILEVRPEIRIPGESYNTRFYKIVDKGTKFKMLQTEEEYKVSKLKVLKYTEYDPFEGRNLQEIDGIEEKLNRIFNG